MRDRLDEIMGRGRRARGRVVSVWVSEAMTRS